MTQETVIDIVSRGLWTIITVAAAPLLLGLTVGLLVSIFQAVTSIQEQTLAFIPKILAVLVAIIIFGPFMLTTLTEFFQSVVTAIPDLIIPR
jgi:flagellar biosynthetic protein FliQ